MFVTCPLVAFSDKSALIVDHSEVSPWWQRIRDACGQSENVLAAFLLAITCRSLAIEIHSSQTKAKVSVAKKYPPISDGCCCLWEWDVAQSIACPPLKRSVVGSILLSGPSCSLSYFPFQPVVHNWFIKGCGMYCSVYGNVHIKDPLLLIEKSSLCGGSGFPF